MLVFEPQNLNEDFAHVYSGDPAIDKTLSDWEERYRKAHETGDVALLPLRDGEKPTVFWLRLPRAGARRKLRDVVVSKAQDEPTSIARRLVATGLQRVDGAEIELKRKAGALDDATLDLLESVDAGALVDELAGAIVARVNADPLSSRGSG